MQWIDIEEIAEALEQKHPDLDVPALRFTMLRKLVIELEAFDDDCSRCNEKILEAIQTMWLEMKKEQRE